MPIANQMFDPGNVAVAAPYILGARSGLIAAGMAAGADFLTIRNAGRLVEGTLKAVPINVSQIRVKFVGATTFTAGGFAIEVHKATGFTVQSSTNGTLVVPVNRKTSLYPAITTAEVSGYVVNTAAAGVTGGTFTIVNASTPVEMAVLGGTGTFPALEGIWKPNDLCPLILEADEGLVFRNVVAMAAGTGVFFAAVDFLRQ